VTSGFATGSGGRSSGLPPRGAILALFLTVLVDRVGFALVIPILPLYAERFGPSPLTLALFMASYPAMQLLFAPLLGRLSDRWGRRPVLALSLLGSAVGYLILAFAPSLELLFLSRLIDGVSGANLLAARAAITDLTGPEGRTRAMGMIGAAFGLGFIFGPALGGILVQFVDWGPGVAAAVLALAAWAMVMTRLPETHPPDPSASIRGWRPVDLPALRRAFARPYLGATLVLVLLLTCARSIFDTTFAQYLVSVHLVQENTVYYLFAYAGLLLVLIQGVAVGPLARRLGDTALLLGGGLLSAVSFVAIPLSGSFPLLIVVLTGLAGGLGVAFPALMSLTSKLATAREVGNVLGLNQSMQSLGRIAGPVLGQLAYGAGAGLPYLTAAAVTAVGAAVGLVMAGRMRSAGYQPDAPAAD
jgi:predicted MFS family arabinose efflux permease